MKRINLIICAALLALAIGAPVLADAYDSTLSGLLGNAPVHAEATYADGLWTYTYTVTITGVTSNVTGFSVGNLPVYSFSDATSNKSFTMPTFNGSDSILWTGGSISANDGPVTFSFKSVYKPGIVNCTLWGSPLPSGGQTLGMVPEPGTFAGLAVACMGMAGTLIRRRISR